MKLLKTFLTASILLTGLVGDYIVFRSKYSDSQLFRALTDNLVHATIGFLSAALFFTHRNISFQTCVFYTIFCTLVSSLIDLDHVFVAKSIYLKDLVNLKHRGIFHCTSFCILLCAVLATYSIIAKKLHTYILTYMLILAFTSHHIRDGNRRGLWLYPFGHTPAINKYVYITLCAVLPYIFAFTFDKTKSFASTKIAYTSMETV